MNKYICMKSIHILLINKVPYAVALQCFLVVAQSVMHIPKLYMYNIYIYILYRNIIA